MSNSKISALTSATTPLAGTEVLPVVQSSTTKQVSVANLTAGRAVTMLSGQVGTKTTSPAGDISSTFSAGLASASAGTAVAATLCNTVAAAVGNETQLTFSPAGNYSATGAVGVVIESTVTANSALKFYTYNAGLLEAARIDSGGNYIPKNAAKGVNFTANTPQAGKTSQLLNWYEEGTWTPTAIPGAGAITAYASGGTYTRVGRQVTVTAYVDLTNVGTASGYLQISNFPFKNGGASGAGYLQQTGTVRETGVTGIIYVVLLAGNSTNGYITSLTGGSIVWVNTYQYALSITYYTA